MNRWIICAFTLFFLFSGVSALEVEKAIINVDTLGRANVEYVLSVQPSKLESFIIPKPIGDVYLTDESGNSIDFKRVEQERTNEIVFTSLNNRTRINFDTSLLVNKIGEFWYFNISLPVKSGATILVSLPQSAVVEYIHATDKTFTYAGTRTLILVRFCPVCCALS